MPRINKKMRYIFPNASIEKSIGHFLCCFATKNPMASGDITVLFNRCFAFCFNQSAIAQKANKLRRVVAQMRLRLRLSQVFPSENLATACLKHSNVFS